MRGACVLAVVACTEPAAHVRPPPWREGPPMPEPRLGASAAALGIELAVAGGDGTAVALFADPTWTHLPDAPVSWIDPGLAAVGGSLYLLGGLEDGVPRGEAFVLGPGATEWAQLPS